MISAKKSAMLSAMQSAYPFASHYLTIGRHRVHYLDEGVDARERAPLVMVHGNPTWSFYYRRLLLALRDRYRVIVPDHIGCGLSDKPPDAEYPYTLKRRIDDLEALLDGLELPRPMTLIMHDWGGAIALGYAVRHPERIARLVLFNTAAFPPPDGGALPLSLRLFRSAAGAVLVRGLNLFCRGAVRYCATRAALPEAVRLGYLSPYDSWRNRIAVHRFVQDIPHGPGHPSHATLQEIDAGLARLRAIPMLLLWGERDFVFTNRFRDEWIRRFPRARVHSFPDGGHFLLEDYFDEVRALIEEFLAAAP